MTTDVAGKLNHRLGDSDLADALVAAGLTTPKLIKAASDQAVTAAVEADNLSAVRQAFPPVE